MLSTFKVLDAAEEHGSTFTFLGHMQTNAGWSFHHRQHRWPSIFPKSARCMEKHPTPPTSLCIYQKINDNI